MEVAEDAMRDLNDVCRSTRRLARHPLHDKRDIRTTLLADPEEFPREPLRLFEARRIGPPFGVLRPPSSSISLGQTTLLPRPDRLFLDNISSM